MGCARCFRGLVLLSARQAECGVSVVCRCGGKADVRVTCSVICFAELVWTVSEVCLCDSRHRNGAKERKRDGV